MINSGMTRSGRQPSTKFSPDLQRVALARIRRVVWPILVGLAGSSLIYLTGWNPPDVDIKFDWLSASGALGADAYANPYVLADEFGVEIEILVPATAEQITGHPRTPGAILLALPLLLVPFKFLFAFSAALSIISTCWLLNWSFDAAERRGAIWRCVLAGCVVASVPSLVNFRYAGMGALVAVLALVSWRLERQGAWIAAGMILGAAISLKVFPALLLFAFLAQRRPRAVVAAIATSAVLNLAGLLLPGVTWFGAISALGAAGKTWGDLAGNASPVRFVAPLVGDPLIASVLVLGLGGTLIAMNRSRWFVRDTPWPWLLLGLVALPISWTSYDLVLIPLLVAAVRADGVSHLTGVFALGLWSAAGLVWLVDEGNPIISGPLVLVARFALLAALVSYQPDRAFGLTWHPLFLDFGSTSASSSQVASRIHMDRKSAAPAPS